MTFNNPDAPATRKQLWLLHKLTGLNTVGLDATIEQCSAMISEAIANRKEASGKTTTAYQQDCESATREGKREVLAGSKLYNRRTGSKRIINVLTNKHGDVREAVTKRTFKNINGKTPGQSNVINHSTNKGKVDTYTAVDSVYSELGYESSDAMMQDVESINQMARGMF